MKNEFDEVLNGRRCPPQDYADDGLGDIVTYPLIGGSAEYNRDMEWESLSKDTSLVTLGRLGKGMHARLSPSAGHRWIPCPGSLYHGKGKDSEAAQRGTHSHRVLELVLTGRTPAAGAWLGDLIDDDGKLLAHGRVVEQYQIDQAIEVLAFLDTHYPKPEFARYSEIQVEIGYKMWPEFMARGDCAGTSDVITFNPDTLVILDAKFGVIQVDALWNTQLILYGLPYIRPSTKRIILYIAQPDFDGVMVFKEWETTPAELKKWEQDNITAILNAHEGSRALKAGDWCKWCAGRATCPSYTEHFQDFMQAEWIAGHSIEEMLPFVDQIKQVCKAIEEKALELAMAGEPVPGYKLVETQKHFQFVEDEAEVVKTAMASVDETFEVLDFYTIKLKSPRAIKKMIGKEAGEKLATMRPTGKPRLVKEDDKRPAIDLTTFTIDDGLAAELEEPPEE